MSYDGSVRFFRISTSATTSEVCALLDKIGAMNLPDRKFQYTDSTLGRLEYTEKIDTLHLGYFVRWVVRNELLMGSDSDPASRLEVKDDKDVLTPTNFLFNPDLMILAIEGKKISLGGHKIQAYLKHFLKTNFDVNHVFELLPVGKSEEVEEIDVLDRITSFQFALATPRNERDSSLLSGVILPLFAAHKAVPSPVLTMKFGVGYSRTGALDKASVRATADALYELEELFGDIVVEGSIAGGERKKLRLKRGLLRSEFSVSCDAKEVPWETRKSILLAAWTENLPYLHRVFGPKIAK